MRQQDGGYATKKAGVPWDGQSRPKSTKSKARPERPLVIYLPRCAEFARSVLM
jgi:hypothetical protein